MPANTPRQDTQDHRGWAGRDLFVYATSQWETTLHCNVVSHWLGAYTKWTLECDIIIRNISSQHCQNWHRCLCNSNERNLCCNRLVSQMRAPLAACRELAGKLWQLCNVLYVFEHKRQYILIHAPFTRIVVFWHIGNVPPVISYRQICCNTATFCIAVIFVKYCYTTGSGLL